MKRTLITAVLALATLPAIAQPHHTFATESDHFTLDGKPFKVLSGELHYARIPREYWHARLKMAKAMGLNTIATYVFWNVHEPTPGHYDFTCNNDLAAFIKAAQQEGLYVILRAGPYSCAEWEFGGLPAWLLADPASAAAIRSNDPAFITPAERWIHRLAQEVAPLQFGRGGPILMTQVENEYGNFGSDHAYMQHLKQIFLAAGFTDSLLDTVDGGDELPLGGIPGVRVVFPTHFVKEFVVNFDEAGKPVSAINEALRAEGIFGGKDLSREFPALGHMQAIETAAGLSTPRTITATDLRSALG